MHLRSVCAAHLQSSYQFLVQKLSRDLEILLEHTRSRDAGGRETALNVERTDGCMRIMRQLGQFPVQRPARYDATRAPLSLPPPPILLSPEGRQHSRRTHSYESSGGRSHNADA